MITGRQPPEKIHKEHLILCEGEDEKQFLIAYLNSKERAENDSRFESSVQVWNFGGNEQLKDGLAVVRRTEGFSKLKTILIIRDAENDAARAIRQIQSSLAENSFSVPTEPGEWSGESAPFISFLLFPTLGKDVGNGTLEHLCMKIIKERYRAQLMLPHISSLMDDLRREGLREFKRDFKSKLHGFLSMTEPFVGRKIGESANMGAFDWDSVELNGLNRCLLEGFDKS